MKKEIDWGAFDEMCAYNCPLEEIAQRFGMSAKELKRRVETEKGKGYAIQLRWDIKRELIDAQLKLAQKNATIAMWLSRHLLGWGDGQDARGELEFRLVEDYGGARGQKNDADE